MTDDKVEIRVILHRPCVSPPEFIGTIKVEKSFFGRLTKVRMCKKCGLFYKQSFGHKCKKESD